MYVCFLLQPILEETDGLHATGALSPAIQRHHPPLVPRETRNCQGDGLCHAQERTRSRRQHRLRDGHLLGDAAAQLSEFDLRAKILPSPVVLKHATCNAGTSSLGIQSGYSTKGLDLADMGSHVAKVLKMEGKIGCVAEGAFADLLLLSANPLEDVTIFNKPAKYVKGIIKDGRVVTSRLDGLKVEVSLM